MTQSAQKFKVYKKILKNGLTVLVRPTHVIPRVESQLWYNVGSKDESLSEKGMAHLIEHMLFKGTKNLSETDINAITHKLCGNANAFTTHDTTCYTFRFPSHVWEESLALFAECMTNATFDQDILISELKTVIEELRMYRDEYQSYLLEKILSSLWPDHAYQWPIIGTVQSLAGITHESLLSFYKKYYYPANATLVVVGDVDVDDVFAKAEKYLGNIPSQAPKTVIRSGKFIPDVCAKSVTLYRPITTPWMCNLYAVPGAYEEKNYLCDIAALVLANGKSSRLHQRLVEKKCLAADVECFVLDFFQRGLFGIGVYPLSLDKCDEIERIIDQEIVLLAKKGIEDWEFLTAQQKIQHDYLALWESIEKQAFLIGNSYMITQDENFLGLYLDAIEKVTAQDVQQFFATYCFPAGKHKGYLKPVAFQDKKRLEQVQKETFMGEEALLGKQERVQHIANGKWVPLVPEKNAHKFSFPKPSEFALNNGLEVMYYHNPLVPQVSVLLHFKVTASYESKEKAGIFSFLLRHMFDETSKYSSEELSKLLDQEGLYFYQTGEIITLRCASKNLIKGLKMLHHFVTSPSFGNASVERIRGQSLNELREFWDTPLEFIDQVAKECMYKNHPYGKNTMGTEESISSFSKKDLADFYKKYLSPHKATLVIVGDVSAYDIKHIVKESLGDWAGECVPEFNYPPVIFPEPKQIHMPLKRDQVVVAFVAPSIARRDKNFDILTLIDIVLTGGMQGSPHSKLFELREKTGLFYAMGGSLIYNARDLPGFMFIKTVVSVDKVCQAKKLILDVVGELGKKGITKDELQMAKNLLFSSSIELFESNISMAQTFLFLKRYKFCFDLFDKQGDLLSIIKIDEVNDVAKKYCIPDRLSVITIGRK